MNDSPKTEINVAYACDRGFLDYLAVSIKSLVREFEAGTHRDTHGLNVFVVAVGFIDQDKELLLHAARSGIARVRLVLINHEFDHRYEGARYENAELICIKYRLPELLPDIDRVVWLDADTIIVSDITELWQVDLGDHWVGTTNSVFTDGQIERYNKSTKSYFWSAENTINAGVMLLDLKLMRRLGVQNILESWVKKFRTRSVIPDQETLAYNFPIRKILDHKWNWRGAICAAEPYWTSFSERECREYSQIRPAIVHLQAPLRPHNCVIKNKYFALWKRYHESLGLGPLRPEPLKLLEFSYLMAKCKASVTFISSRPIFALLHLPLLARHIISYVRYRKDPDHFDFPLLE